MRSAVKSFQRNIVRPSQRSAVRLSSQQSNLWADVWLSPAADRREQARRRVLLVSYRPYLALKAARSWS
jgi:hypothetical protein